MPELPEVEVVVNWLSRTVRERQIERVEVKYPRLIRALSPEAFSRRLKGGTIIKIGRRGKYILIELDKDRTLLVHLRMTGEFFYVENDREIRKQTAAVFYLDNKHKLVFDDHRHFGVMKLAQTSKLENTEELSALGPEPFGKDFTDKYLYGVLQGSARSIKELLLDQTKVAGLGNIYAAEALFAAKINPKLRANELSKSQANRLHKGIFDVLNRAVKTGKKAVKHADESIENYFEGGYDRFAVYGREGKPCLRCGSMIKRIVQGSRSTFYCPNCQKK